MLRTIGFASLMSVITLTSLTTISAAAEPLKVVASFSIIGDFARNVGGDRIELTTLVGPDGDAHVYEPSPADAVKMSKADVVLVNGLQFEGFLQRLVEASATKASVVELTKGVEPIKMKEEHEHAAEAGGDDHHHGDLDPHAFQSIANAKIYVKNIADAFCAADAAGCDAYKSNADAYTAKLTAAETEVKEAVASIPEAKRTVITSHDAFGYFENAYGLTFLAPEGISTEAEASAADVAALISQVRGDKASAIFVENITNPRLVEQISAETGVKVGGTLYSDALSKADGPAATYIDMMKSNIATIKGAILGS
ncbi:zinc ABC transporter substrate-binding protein AztC [Aminobacter sp. NyZ550]|uniref:zinc ABC transporter substrate-binding protein AztC n=1 Tax=unclassified Aminobacter TaxID=2644704 RepID=UPI0021D5A059|nr:MULTISPECIES: zinc ABC transporter substrate-binding protein AztC [unclassified Aminobacter]WAX94054.1 zinc ABC transporter substrate-binding protein AztC [Aminobacter sp. NyZ550]BBD37386.1 metal ABC transporter substrate-binding protein [Aminobacter sp. SS-2016]